MTNSSGTIRRAARIHIIVINVRTLRLVRTFRNLTGYKMARHLSRLIAVIVNVLAVTETPGNENNRRNVESDDKLLH